MITDYRLG